jgi:dual-specificity kinase
MSTPSTATATHPSHHPHYGYSHHQVAYQTNGAYPPTSSAGPARLANNYAYSANTPTSVSTQSHPIPSAPKPAPSSTSNLPAYNPSSSSGSMSSGPASRRRKPDWGEFYKNGLPKEVIVIDDTPPPDQTAPHSHAASSTVTATNNAQPAGKKRRTGVETAYDVGFYDRPSYSINPQHYGDGSSGGSLSTDRTTSLHTTAPTSMGSNGSSGTSNGVYYEEANVGQKRKRVTTRKSARDEQKRRELETAGDAFLNYIPPPQPPIKAKDVPVPVIRDVRALSSVIVCRVRSVLML